MRWKRMGAPTVGDQATMAGQHGAVVEEIKGLIKVYRDGHVERLPVIPDVPAGRSHEHDVTSKDVVVNHTTGVWARIYVPNKRHPHPLPLMIYFHGGGFCVGSASWSCYHDFLARLASLASCIIVSVNYRLAPEHRLPAAYKDGLDAVKWVGHQSTRPEHDWWRAKCNLSKVFLAGDSAGAAIAYHVATQWQGCAGLVLVQPFFGGEARTGSERGPAQQPSSALSLETSDRYWRLALPAGSNRDHKWCNPMAKDAVRMEEARIPATMVCVSETDVLRDRELEFCKAMRRAGKEVEHVVYWGVGHAFQVLSSSPVSQIRRQEMMMDIKAFVSSR